MAGYNEMTAGKTMPQIFRFTVPLLMGNMLQQAYSLIDAAIVGKFLGIGPLAAVGASSSVIFLILGFCNGCSAGFGIPVAQRFGARDYSAMRRYIYSGMKLTAVLSVFIAVITALTCRAILQWMSTPDGIFSDAYWYLLITFIGIPATFFYNLLSCIIRALGDSKTPFWFLLFSACLNVVLDLVCIINLGWGVPGAAIATVVSQAVSAALCYFYMIRKFDILSATRNERKYSGTHGLTLLKIGVPMGLQFSITAIGSIMLQSANNSLGTNCIAAFTAAMRIKMFMITPCDSLGMAMATFAGQNYGAGRPDRIRQGVRSGLLLIMIYCVAAGIVLLMFSSNLALLFVSRSDVEIINDTTLFLHVAAYFMPLLGLLCVLRYTIQGAGFTTFAMCSGVMEMFARAAVSLWSVPAFGFIAVCLGDSAAWLAADIFLVPALFYVYGKIKSLRPDATATTERQAL